MTESPTVFGGGFISDERKLTPAFWETYYMEAPVRPVRRVEGVGEHEAWQATAYYPGVKLLLLLEWYGWLRQTSPIVAWWEKITDDCVYQMGARYQAILRKNLMQWQLRTSFLPMEPFTLVTS